MRNREYQCRFIRCHFVTMRTFHRLSQMHRINMFLQSIFINEWCTAHGAMWPHSWILEGINQNLNSDKSKYVVLYGQNLNKHLGLPSQLRTDGRFECDSGHWNVRWIAFRNIHTFLRFLALFCERTECDCLVIFESYTYESWSTHYIKGLSLRKSVLCVSVLPFAALRTGKGFFNWFIMYFYMQFQVIFWAKRFITLGAIEPFLFHRFVSRQVTQIRNLLFETSSTNFTPEIRSEEVFINIFKLIKECDAQICYILI